MAGRLIVIRRRGGVLSLLFDEKRLIGADVCRESETLSVGDIFIGKVKNVVKNINAAFVDAGESLCFLPLKGLKSPFLTNRKYDGRLLAGDEIVLQITREAMKTKEAFASAQLSLAGKYAVAASGSGRLSFSGKLSDAQKEEIRAALAPLSLETRNACDIIIRTNAGGLPEYGPLIKEINRLLEEWDELYGKAAYRTCYSVLKKAPASYLTNLRDSYGGFEKIVVADKELYEQFREWLAASQPEELCRLQLYSDPMLSLEALYGVETKLSEAVSKKVWLRSGGYLIIEPTEALTAIDVNTGKYDGRKSEEETFSLINQEACREIALQLRLRNLSGIIIVDFINMKEQKDRDAVMSSLNKLVRQDPVKTSVVDMTPLGLVEITRKRTKPALWEQLKEIEL